MDEVWWLSDQGMYVTKRLALAVVVDRIIGFELQAFGSTGPGVISFKLYVSILNVVDQEVPGFSNCDTIP